VPITTKIQVLLTAIVLVAALSCGAGAPSGPDTALSCPDCPPLLVERVVDGDTFDSSKGRVRLYGVNTPERGKKCFTEATDRLQELAGDFVRVEPGPRLEDGYSRPLFYAYTEDGQSIDETLVAEGLALAWTKDGQHREILVAAEGRAREEGNGCLW
jgi:endonuclease YncB( thermonuclease family)